MDRPTLSYVPLKLLLLNLPGVHRRMTSTFRIYVVLSWFSFTRARRILRAFQKRRMNGRRSSSSLFSYKSHTALFRIIFFFLWHTDPNVLAGSSFRALFSICGLFVRRSIWLMRTRKYSTRHR